MKKISIEDVDSDGIDVDRRRLSEVLGATDVAINRYRLAPGEGLPGGLHAHVDQEEVFLVVEGEATFETLVPRGGADGAGGGPGGRARGREGGEVTVREGEAIRFAPGEFQSGRNDADADLVVLAVGAPRDSEDVRIPVACPECGHGDVRLETSGEGVQFVCPDCGAERVPRGCPECGRDELRVALGDDGGTIVVCRGCGAEFEDPPLEG